MMDTRIDCPIVSRPWGLSTKTRIERLPVCGSATRPTNATLPGMPCSCVSEESGSGTLVSECRTIAVCPTAQGERRPRREPDRCEHLLRINDLTNRAADGDCLTRVAIKAFEHAVNWRADRVVIEMCLGEGNQGSGCLDSTLSFGDRLRPRTDHHRVKRCLSRLLLVLSRLKRLLSVEELLLRRKMLTRQ